MQPRSVNEGPVRVRSTLSKKHPMVFQVMVGSGVGSMLQAETVVDAADVVVVEDKPDKLVVLIVEDVLLVELPASESEGDGRTILVVVDEASVVLVVAGAEVEVETVVVDWGSDELVVADVESVVEAVVDVEDKLSDL